MFGERYRINALMYSLQKYLFTTHIPGQISQKGTTIFFAFLAAQIPECDRLIIATIIF